MKSFTDFMREQQFEDEAVEVRQEIDEMTARLRRASGIIFNAKDSTLTDAKEYIFALRDETTNFLKLTNDFLTGRSVHL